MVIALVVGVEGLGIICIQDHIGVVDYGE